MSLLEEAKEKIYNSPIVKYVDKQKIEEAFKKIYVYSDKEEFLKVYGSDSYRDRKARRF